MIYDTLHNNQNNEPKYRCLYLDIKLAIEKGSLKKGDKIPSIRKLCEELNLSKTTVEMAYNQLCSDGYIHSVPQSGFLVEANFEALEKNTISTSQNISNFAKSHFEYDFGSKTVDYIDISVWKKYLKDILNKPYLLSSYGDACGEFALRKALQRYLFDVRGVNTNYNNIVIGAGMQVLLYLLCGPLKIGNKIAIEKGAYPQAEQIFNDFGINVVYAECDSYGITPASLEKLNVDLVLINPNYSANSCKIMPIQRRVDIINICKKRNILIIEDDFNGELRYTSHPMSALQSYGNDVTIYLGSFSKLLLPSVRIGYMVLPNCLKDRLTLINDKYNQTASKLEQLALATFISDGKLETHLRRLRKLYHDKSNILINCIKEYFPNDTQFILNETALCVGIYIKDMSAPQIYKTLQNNSINTIRTTFGKYNLVVGFSGIEIDKIDSGIKKISDLLII